MTPMAMAPSVDKPGEGTEGVAEEEAEGETVEEEGVVVAGQVIKFSWKGRRSAQDYLKYMIFQM